MSSSTVWVGASCPDPVSRSGRSVTFNAVAREAAVSTDFLYRHPTIRDQIERRRDARTSATSRAPTERHSTSSALRALTNRLTEQRQVHRQEADALRRALAVAHGENLELRRRLARYELV
jgi:hypothetical protein